MMIGSLRKGSAEQRMLAPCVPTDGKTVPPASSAWLASTMTTLGLQPGRALNELG